MFEIIKKNLQLFYLNVITYSRLDIYKLNNKIKLNSKRIENG